MKILIIEDDQIHADDLRKGLTVDSDLISTEAEFRRRYRKGELKDYSLAVVDLMLRWTDPAPDMEPPEPDVLEEGSYTAGLRCCRLLAAQGTPCVIFTTLSPDKVLLKPGDDFQIIRKSGQGLAALLERIGSIA